jgi:ferrochelatase
LRQEVTSPYSVAVILFQLGGPDSLEAVEPFLYNLFADPDIIEFPFARLTRPILARLVASRRAGKVLEHYVRIGGKSPIRELTELQGKALERELRQYFDARVFVAMRYWRPFAEEALQAVIAQGFREVVLLPLYPQYSKTTTGSSLNDWYRKLACLEAHLPSAVIREFYDHPLYLEAVVEHVNQGLARFREPNGSSESERPSNSQEVHLVFSAHGLPVSVIEAGDPYQAQVKATVKLVLESGGWSNPHRLCYQSRVSPGRWLQPSLDSTLEELAAEGAESILIIPISFVSDHIETLYEIDIEARERALRAGIKRFELMPALNSSPAFIRSLASIILREVRSRAESAPSVGI